MQNFVYAWTSIWIYPQTTFKVTISLRTFKTMQTFTDFTSVHQNLNPSKSVNKLNWVRGNWRIQSKVPHLYAMNWTFVKIKTMAKSLVHHAPLWTHFLPVSSVLCINVEALFVSGVPCSPRETCVQNFSFTTGFSATCKISPYSCNCVWNFTETHERETQLITTLKNTVQ